MTDGNLIFSEVVRHGDLTGFYLDAALEIEEGWEKESGVFFSEVAWLSNALKNCERDGERAENGVFSAEKREDLSDCITRAGGTFVSADGSGLRNSLPVAAYSLSRRFGVTVLDYIAVNGSQRKGGIGSILIDRIKKKCRDLNEKKIYLTAKARGFFLKNGAREIGEKSPLYSVLLGECAECDQRGKECFPVVMEIDI